MTEFLKLKKSNCKNCYKCIRHCPVKSIRFSAGQANIVGDECILCGQCFVVCPQNAKQIADDTERVRVMLYEDAPVVASIAPSFAANYVGVGIGELESALKQLGFAAAEETARGATLVKQEYDRLLESGERDILISSCCHSVNLLIQKYFPAAIQYLADVVTPMHAHCADIKRRYPGARTVFIGPCVSKKDEAERSGGTVDAVLTFEELSNWLESKQIVLTKNREAAAESRARLFPITGGILRTMECKAQGYDYLAIDGVDSCIAALRDIESGSLSRCFIEMSACVGSCANGPVMEKYNRAPIRAYQQITSYAGGRDFVVEPLPQEDIHRAHGYLGTSHKTPTNEELAGILRQMGKTRPDQELNCGSCGYNTCRDKAVAIFQGKADLSMCLPFLKDKAESFSDNIIYNTPNGIFVLNEDLEVQQINRAAKQLMNIRNSLDILGEPVVRIMDPKIFMDARQKGKGVYEQRAYLAEYDKYVEQTVIYDKDYRIIVCIMRDVTQEETQHAQREDLSRRTIDIADRVVEKQMRVVQDIASLLGETVAETKIALTKLKESMVDE